MSALNATMKSPAPSLPPTAIYFPQRDGRPPELVPYVLTDADMIRFLRLDETGIEHPEQTLAYYRKRGLLRATQIGRYCRYKLPEVIAFLDRIDAVNPH